MSTLYTLASEMFGKHGEALNGKVFYISLEPGTNCAVFLEPTSKGVKPLWKTTEVITTKEFFRKEGWFATQNSTYHLVRVDQILPSNPSKKEQPVEQETTPLTIINSERGPIKFIHYGDGYKIEYITVNREATEDEIRCLLKTLGDTALRKDEAAWWEDYMVINPMGNNKWELKEVNRYTD